MKSHRRYLERLFSKFTVGDDCWLWQAAIERGVYGSFHVNGREIKAHKVVYELLVGPVPEGMELDHLCRRRACVNPKHLEPVTHVENMRRAVVATGGGWTRPKSHCLHGHPYDEANTYLWQGRRHCRACRHDVGVRYRAEQRSP